MTPTRGEADVDDGLPTQMRAEQAISAFMTIAPIARQSTLAGSHGLQKEGAADAADSEIAASKESKAALAAGSEGTELEQQSRPRDASISNREAARPAAQAKDIVAEAAVAATSPQPAREHSATATGDAKANAAREAGQQATPADAAVPAADCRLPADLDPAAMMPATQSKASRVGAVPLAKHGGPTRWPPSAKVSIIAEQAAPAPAAASLSANGAAIVDAIGADSSWRAAAHLSSALLAPSPKQRPTNARTQDPAASFGAGCCNGASTNRRRAALCRAEGRQSRRLSPVERRQRRHHQVAALARFRH